MDPETVEVLTALVSDAIKILGPAVIAAVATYKTARSQYEARIEEIKRGHEFSARERLYEYYQYRQESLARNSEKISRSLGELIGMNVGGAFNEGLPEAAKPIVALFNTYHATANFTAKVVLRDMARKGMENSEEYLHLHALRENCENIGAAQDMATAVTNFESLMEFYDFLDSCNHLLFEREIESLFEKYRGG